MKSSVIRCSLCRKLLWIATIEDVNNCLFGNLFVDLLSKRSQLNFLFLKMLIDSVMSIR